MLEIAGSHLSACCDQPRYKTAWLIGAPLSGKTTLARQLCAHYNWQYLNYTLEDGYFERLQDRLETLQPSDLLQDIRIYCTSGTKSILLIDEIDAVLACWSQEQRGLFLTRAGRLADLPRGLILVSNLFDINTLTTLLPESDFPTYFHLHGGNS